LQEIVVPDWLNDKELLVTDQIQEIFKLNPNDGPLNNQANKILNKIWSTIQEAKIYREKLVNK